MSANMKSDEVPMLLYGELEKGVSEESSYSQITLSKVVEDVAEAGPEKYDATLFRLWTGIVSDIVIFIVLLSFGQTALYPGIRLFACLSSLISAFYLAPIIFVYHYYHLGAGSPHAPSFRMPLIVAGLALIIGCVVLEAHLLRQDDLFGLTGPVDGALVFVSDAILTKLSLQNFLIIDCMISFHYGFFFFGLLWNIPRYRAGSKAVVTE